MMWKWTCITAWWAEAPLFWSTLYGSGAGGLEHRAAEPRQHPADRRGRLVRQLVELGLGLLRDHQRMPQGQRVDVQERQHVLVLVHLVAGDLAAQDLAEDGLAHRPDLRHWPR
jgi:hypothetical protein